MHSDITRIINEFHYRDHVIKIVEREKGRLFLYFYVEDKNGKQRGGMYYGGYSSVTEEDLSNLSICIPKIKQCLDNNIASMEKWEKEQMEKKKKMNWTGRKFKRGDFVHFKGNEEYKSEDTYVWAYFGHLGMGYYVIEHTEGMDKINFINKPPYREFGIGSDGFEAIHSSQLNDGLKYIKIFCNKFHKETDELIMIKEVELDEKCNAEQ